MNGERKEIGITDCVMLDFEASGLELQGWPIEIGLSWIVDSALVQTWASLIRPHEDWSMDHWSEQSAAVHGIALEDLETAPAAEEVAREVFARCERYLVLSDAPEFEQRWLYRLLATVGQAGALTIRDYDAVTFKMFDGPRLDHVYEHLARHPGPHRAGPDSVRLANAWVAAARHAPE